MNLVGLELLARFPERVEDSSTSPTGQLADEGDFLAQFLGMLFAETESDSPSAETAQLALTPEQLATQADSEVQEVLREVPWEEEGFLNFPAEFEAVPDEEEPAGSFEGDSVTADESTWVVPVTPRQPEASVPQNESSFLEPATSREMGPKREDKTDSTSGQESSLWLEEKLPSVSLTSESAGTESATTSLQGVESGGFLGATATESQFSAHRQAGEGQVVSRPELNRAASEGSISEARVQKKIIDFSTSYAELSHPKTSELLNPPLAHHRPHPVSSTLVPEQESDGPESGPKLPGVHKSELDVAKAPVEINFGSGTVGREKTPRNHPIVGGKTVEEPSARRPEITRHSGRVDDARTAHHRPEPLASVHPDADRSTVKFTRATILKTDHSSEGVTLERTGADSYLKTERAALSEPLPLTRGFTHAQSLQYFDHILDQIVKQISLQQKGETFQLGVRLKPEFLGELRIETILEADKTVRAVIHAEDPSVKALLENKVATLVQRFDDAGIHVNKVEIQTFLADAGTGNDGSKGRQEFGQAATGKSQLTPHSERSEQESSSDRKVDDGHIHLFI